MGNRGLCGRPLTPSQEKRRRARENGGGIVKVKAKALEKKDVKSFSRVTGEKMAKPFAKDRGLCGRPMAPSPEKRRCFFASVAF